MDFPFHYDHAEALIFGGALPARRSFDESRVVILPVPVDRTTSYVGGTRNGPREILQASSHLELWDEELRADVHGVGIFTLPEMELPFGEMQAVVDEIERVAYEIIGRDKFLVTLGGEHSITPPLVSAASRKYPTLSVLQIDAHADMRDAYMGTVHNHACAMRRALEFATLTQVGIRSLSTEEAEVLPRMKTTVFYDVEMRNDPDWIDAVVASLGDHVYVSHRRRRNGSGNHARHRNAGTGRTVVAGGDGAASGDRRAPPRGCRRRRRIEPDPGDGGSELSLRQAHLQAVDVLLRR